MLLPLQLNIVSIYSIPADATWPLSLPLQVLQQGYSETQPQSSAIRTAMESGRPKQRSRYTALNLPFSAVFEMSSAQLDIFWAFYRTTLKNGCLTFDGLPHVRTGSAINHQFNVATPPQVRADGWDSYLVSVSLEVVP